MSGAQPEASRLRCQAPPGRRGASARALRVLLVDAQTLSRQGLKTLLSQEPDLEIVGDVGVDREALKRVRAVAPDIALVDIPMRNGDGIEAVRTIKRRYPASRVIVLVTDASPDLLRQATEVGAAGFVLKNVSAAHLADAIRAVGNGAMVIDPLAAKQLIKGVGGDGATPSTQGAQDLMELAPRDIEILTEVACGLTDKEIAAKLFLSEFTVKNRLRALYDRFKLRNRAHAACLAVCKGLVAADVFPHGPGAAGQSSIVQSAPMDSGVGHQDRWRRELEPDLVLQT
jgi:DNA-binding NarL/FixJ family response regulator